jgi:hypothetical protein
MRTYGLNSVTSRWGWICDICENSNQTSSYIKSWDFFDKLSSYQLLNKDPEKPCLQTLILIKLTPCLPVCPFAGFKLRTDGRILRKFDTSLKLMQLTPTHTHSSIVKMKVTGKKVKLSLCLTSTMPWRRMGGVELQLHHYWPRYYMEVSGQLHVLAALPRGKCPSGNWTRGWVGPTADPNAEGKRKYPAPGGNRTPVVQPVARCYTDWAIPA